MGFIVLVAVVINSVVFFKYGIAAATLSGIATLFVGSLIVWIFDQIYKNTL